MGASTKAWMLPGSTISSFIDPRLGWITRTVGTACSRVSCLTTAAARMRELIPRTTMLPARSRHIPKNTMILIVRAILFSGYLRGAPMQKTENHRDKE